MKRWSRIVLFSSVSLLFVACGNETTEEEVREPETEVQEVSAQDGTYQDWLNQAQAQVDAGQPDAAAGTLAELLNEDLSEYPGIQASAEQLLDEVNRVLAEEAREVAGSVAEGSAYAEERQSTTLAEEYLEDTEESLAEATDEEIEVWLEQREAARVEAEQVAEETEEEEAENAPRFATKAEAEDYAFEQTMAQLSIESENIFSFVSQQEDGWVQIEIRENQEEEGLEWSTMIGIYRYNVETDVLEVRDAVTGAYEEVN